MESVRKFDKVFKTATKNLSVKFRDVNKSQLPSILEATNTIIYPLHNKTNDDAYKRFHVVERVGGELQSNGDVNPLNPENKIVAITGPRYELVQHSDILDNVFSVLDDNGINYSIPKLYVDQREGLNKFYANIRLDDIKDDIDGSPVSPTIDVFNSTDGKSSAGLIFGAYRSRCENGMVLGVEYGYEKILHTPSIISRIQFEKMYEDVLGRFNNLKQSIEMMQEKKFEKTMLETLAKMGFFSPFIKNYTTIATNYMLDLNESVPSGTVWELYATATNFLSNYLMLKNYEKAVKSQKILYQFSQNLITGQAA